MQGLSFLDWRLVGIYHVHPAHRPRSHLLSPNAPKLRKDFNWFDLFHEALAKKIWRLWIVATKDLLRDQICWIVKRRTRQRHASYSSPPALELVSISATQSSNERVCESERHANPGSLEQIFLAHGTYGNNNYMNHNNCRRHAPTLAKESKTRISNPNPAHEAQQQIKTLGYVQLGQCRGQLHP